MLLFFAALPDGTGYDYDTATALIITFVVKNHLHDNRKAMAWEKAFLDYLKDYKKKAKYIDIEYSAKVLTVCLQNACRDIFSGGARLCIVDTMHIPVLFSDCTVQSGDCSIYIHGSLGMCSRAANITYNYIIIF